MKTATAAAIASLTLLSAGCGRESAPLLKETRFLMGTVVSVEAEAHDEAETRRALEAAWAEMSGLEQVFSRWRPESELNRIREAPPGTPTPLSPVMLEVLLKARELGRLTGGAFDPTVGPLLSLWGFFPEGGGTVPGKDAIADARNLTGWDKLRVDPEAGTATLLASGVELDLAGVAKGFIADRGAAALVRAGAVRGLVNAGGDIACFGGSPDGGPWRIGLEDPRHPGAILTVLRCAEGGIATSGDYRNYFIRSRKRYSHIIDPRTGAPADAGVVEASVTAPDCATADGLATGLFVLGPGPGISLLDRLPGVEGIIVTEGEEGLLIWRSSGLEETKPAAGDQ
ncbi:MAG TPA: FAD:protein FMN transferase [bacterium]|nr:FAD:protein FMN transferase [bacterium]HPQ66024.1 FAD:protein FMN transferase [bacterium]